MTDDMSTAIEPIPIPHVYMPLLRSNACPSIKACTDIHSLIDQHQRQRVTIQKHVARLKAHLADLERLETETEDTLARLHAALAPIKRLPPEVLSEVFEHCLDTSNAMLFSATSKYKEAPLLLGRVCRSWRTVAHATPRLWRDIVVNVCDGRYSDELRRDALPVLQTWLAHSGSLPLKLIMLCKTERVLPGLMDIFEIIAAHGARWKTVHVRLQNSPVIRRLVCCAFSKCTGLSAFDVTDGGQCMSFFGTRQQGVEEVQPIHFDLSVAPLEQLSLSLAGLNIRDIDGPWKTLTRLSFMQDARSSTTSITDYAAVLKECRSLRECGITIDSGVVDGPLEEFTLPSLECLRIQVFREASHTTQTADLLSMLHAPRLRALSVEDYCPRRDMVLYHAQLKAFLHGHQRTLRHLRFSTSSKHFTSDDMIGLVVETPFLVELEYRPDEESSPSALLDALTPHIRGGVLACLLPCLERLFVYWDTKETVSMVGDMIERRYAMVERGIARLTHLSCKPVRISMVYDCMPPSMLVENLATRLEPLCHCGLQVDWEAYRYDLEFAYC